MNTNKILGGVLIIAGLAAGYMGINKISKNEASIEVLNVDVDLSNKEGKKQGYIYLGIGVLLIAAGFYTISKK